MPAGSNASHAVSTNSSRIPAMPDSAATAVGRDAGPHCAPPPAPTGAQRDRAAALVGATVGPAGVEPFHCLRVADGFI